MTDNWISVEDRLPDHNQFVLAANKQKSQAVLRFDLNVTDGSYCFMWPDLRHQVTGITHWMPLPRPTEEK